ncbi:MAG: DUF2948 family protein [Pseudomonadota bacterium]
MNKASDDAVAADEAPRSDEADRTAGDAGSDPSAAPPQDAAFEDGFQPMRLAARDGDDLKVLSALLQDAVVTSDEMAYLRPQRRFAMVLNRFRWEEPQAQERVRAGVHFDGVLSAKVKGFRPGAEKQPLNLLAIEFTPGEIAPAGEVRIVFSGGAEAALSVEALEAAMADMTKPWRAAARPIHRG